MGKSHLQLFHVLLTYPCYGALHSLWAKPATTVTSKKKEVGGKPRKVIFVQVSVVTDIFLLPLLPCYTSKHRWEVERERVPTALSSFMLKCMNPPPPMCINQNRQTQPATPADDTPLKNHCGHHELAWPWRSPGEGLPWVLSRGEA